MKIKASLDYAMILANRSCPVHFALQLEAPDRTPVRPHPAAFCLVLDRSGSMQGPPLHKAKEAAKLVVRNLRAADSFGLVIFESGAQVLVPMHPAVPKETMIKAIDGIVAGGSTNLTGGWSLGRDELKWAAGNASRRLLLLSDGHLNEGIVAPEAVRQIVAAGLETYMIRTSCLGFGDQYNEDIMTSLAQVTSGQFYDADSAEKLPEILANELDGLQKITIQNLRVRVRKLDFCDAVQCLGNYACVDRPDGWTEVFIGDLVSAETRVVCFALEVLPVPVVEGRAVVSLEGECLLECELLYDEITDNEVHSRSFSQIVRIQATQDPKEVRRTDEAIPWVALQRAGRVIDEVKRRMDSGEVEVSLEAIREAIASLEAYGPEAPVGEAIGQLRSLLTRIQEGDWSLRERKLSKYKSHSYLRMSSSEHWSGSEPPPSFKKRPGSPPAR